MNDSVLLTLEASKRLQVAEICKLTGLSVATVMERVTELNAAGANIEVHGDRLRWLEPFECLRGAEISAALANEECAVEVLEIATSTNAILAAENIVHGRVVLAEYQSAGVGRRGKTWLSPLGKNLYMSCGWNLPSSQLFSALSLAVGVSIAGALRDFGCVDIGLKWPNDLYIKGSKVGGLLIDSTTSGKSAKLIVGIGINIFRQEFPANLDVPATTLAEEYPALTKNLNRNRLAAVVLEAIFKELSMIARGESTALAAWRSYDVSYNKPVSVLKGSEVVTGVAQGITSDGEFVLDVENEIMTFSQADVSLRI